MFSCPTSYMRTCMEVRSWGTRTTKSPGSCWHFKAPPSGLQAAARYRQTSTSRCTKKLLSRMAELLGIRKGCSAGFEDEAVVIFSSRNSLLGNTVSEPPEDWLHS